VLTHQAEEGFFGDIKTDMKSAREVEDYAITVNAGNRTIGNLVWIDADNDGVKDDMETGEPGVPV
jgi:hypothetical protein